MRRLGPRLVALMALALLPLTVLAYLQTDRMIRLSQSRAEAAILGDTLAAAAPMDRGITRARGVVQALAAMTPGLGPAACSAMLAQFVADSGYFSFAGFTGLDGQMDCASKGAHRNFADSPRFMSLIADPKPTLTAIPAAQISGTSVLTLTEPAYSDGRLVGIMALSVPQAVLRSEVKDEAAALVVMDEEGNVLTSSLPLDETPRRMPRGWTRAHLAGDVRDSFVATAEDGTDYAFAVVSVVPGQIYLLGSWPVDRLLDELPTPALPVLIWAASLVVVWIAAETQVLRHVRRLHAAITRFAQGDRRLEPLTLRAPSELEDIGRSFQSMALSVTHGEAELEDTIREKQILLREVHHRVMNNLQLIASILNMQGRTVQLPETRAAMGSVKERVLSLATIHRQLYETSGLAEVRMDELLPQVLRHQLRLATEPGRQYDLEFRIDDIRMSPDQAVPLALWLTEGVTNVIRHGAATAGHVALGLELVRQPDGQARMVLENPVSGVALEGEGALGSKLLTAFAKQFGGHMTRERRGALWRLEVVFPLAQG